MSRPVQAVGVAALLVFTFFLSRELFVIVMAAIAIGLVIGRFKRP